MFLGFTALERVLVQLCSMVVPLEFLMASYSIIILLLLIFRSSTGLNVALALGSRKGRKSIKKH